MAVTEFPDGIKIGPDSLPVYMMDEWVTNETVELGEMAANEIRTLVFESVETVRAGAKVFCAPMTPALFQTLQVRAAYVSGEQEVSVIVKNDSDVAVTYTLNESFLLSYWNTSAPPEA